MCQQTLGQRWSSQALGDHKRIVAQRIKEFV
jgi:hypothetical protein